MVVFVECFAFLGLLCFIFFLLGAGVEGVYLNVGVVGCVSDGVVS